MVGGEYFDVDDDNDVMPVQRARCMFTRCCLLVVKVVVMVHVLVMVAIKVWLWC